MSLELGVLVSGNGSNLQAVIDAIEAGTLDANVRLVLSNRPAVRALERAREVGIPTLVLNHREFDGREAFDAAVVDALERAEVQWVVLAGFMRVLTPVFLDAFEGRVINIHPSLLPAFPGVDAQRQAFEYGVKLTGCTVHFVDQGVDSGPIIAQAAVPVLDQDDADTLRARILEQEHRILVKALVLLAQGRVQLGQSPSGRTTTKISELDERDEPNQ